MSLCRENGTLIKTWCAVIGMIVTILITVFTDRLIMERREATLQEKVAAVELNSAQFARKDVVDSRFKAIEEGITDLKANQSRIYELLLSMKQKGRN